MEKKTVSNEGMENTIHSTKQSLGMNQIESPSEHLIAGLRTRRARLTQDPNKQDTENTLSLHRTLRVQPFRNASVPR